MCALSHGEKFITNNEVCIFITLAIDRKSVGVGSPRELAQESSLKSALMAAESGASGGSLRGVSLRVSFPLTASTLKWKPTNYGASTVSFAQSP